MLAAFQIECTSFSGFLGCQCRLDVILLRLLSFEDERSGPRIGMTHDCDFYRYFLDHGRYPEEGLKGYAYSNSGVMLIRPGKILNILKICIYINSNKHCEASSW